MPFADIFKRMGKSRTRVTFFVEVQTLVISSISGVESGDDLNVLFEKGEKSVCTAPKTLSSLKNDKLTVTFSEILRLDATLYKDSNGVYQEKVGKLTVRQRKSGTAGLKAGKDAFKAIGVAPLQLHTFVNNAEAHQQLCLPLLWCMADTATLTVTVSTRISESAQNSEADSDDNSSITSTPSLQSQVGGSVSTISSTNRPPASSSASRLTSTINTKPVVPPIQSKLSQPPQSTGKVAAPAPPQEEGSPISWAARKGSKTSKPTSRAASEVPPSDDGSEDGPRPSTGSFKTNVGTKGPSFTVDDWQPDFNGSQSSTSVKENSNNKGYDDGFGNHGDHWGDSDVPMRTSPMQKMGEKLVLKNGGKGNSPSRKSESDEEILRLQEEIRELKAQNISLKSKADAKPNQSSPVKNNETEPLKLKIKKLTEQLKETEKDLYQTKIERDEKSNENTKLLKDILDLKMSAVPLIKDSEYWKTSCSELKMNLQAYAARLTTMEVQMAEAGAAHTSSGRRSPTVTSSALYDQPLPSQPVQRPTPVQLVKQPQVIQQQQQPPPVKHIAQKEVEPVYTPAPAAAGTSKFSNFVNSTKATAAAKVPEPNGYAGKRAPVSHYSAGGLDLS